MTQANSRPPHLTKDQWVRKLDLKPHREGGFYTEIYRNATQVPPEDLGPEYQSRRSLATCIYFMLMREHFSAFHIIHSDELWHFLDGGTVRIHFISPEGEYFTRHCGSGLAEGEWPIVHVPGKHWFAAETLSDFSLVSCTVMPGFDYEDFALATHQELIQQYPQHEAIIRRLTRQ